jgi:SAM-dependent methyltransferase
MLHKMKATIAYYNKNAESWLAYVKGRARNNDDLYPRFLKHLPAKARILDAGCGTGHDSVYFKKHGYRVTAFDAAKEMVAIARNLTGLPVTLDRFETVKLKDNFFDGIWTNASLLHVAQKDIPRVYKKLWRSLKPGGAWHIKIRYGREPMLHKTRYFSGLTKKTFLDVMDGLGPYEMVSFDIHKGSAPWRWIDAVIIKK